MHLYQVSDISSELEIACEVNCSAFLRCYVEWKFESTSVDTSDKYKVTNNGSLHNLLVFLPTKKDLGRYTCILKSIFHENEDSRVIIVKTPGKP